MSDRQFAMSPISPGKWEYERRNHFYFLESAEYRELAEAQKHVFLIGHRGTGKTTLLRSLDWGERLSSPQLVGLVNGQPFSDGNLGCFIGLKVLNLELFEAWLHDSNPAVSHLVLGSYFRAVWIEEGVRAVQAVARQMSFDSLSSEAETLGEIREDLDGWIPAPLASKTFDGAPAPAVTLSSLRQFGASLRDRLHGAATISTTSPEAFVEDYRLSRVQMLTGRVFHALSMLLEKIDSDIPWRFRICMDEGEYLSGKAKQTVRTLVRESESPLFMVVAALSDLGTATATPGVTITLDDRKIVDLDERPINELASLINGVVNARLEHLDFSCSFDIKSLLGGPGLNELLLSYPTENSDMAALREAWSDWSPGEVRGPSPIRSFLESESLAVPLAGLSAAESRRLDSRGYRKYEVAGYFLLLGRMDLKKPFFAGWRVFLNMSDNSLRDLLLALDLVQKEYNKRSRGTETHETYCRFLEHVGVPFRTQDTALRRLGSEKLGAFSEKVIHFTVPARRLLNFVGRLTHALDFGFYRPAAGPRVDAGKLVVTLPEPPILKDRATIDATRNQGTQGRFIDILLECAEEGFLKILEIDTDSYEVTFRLHHTLSRYYGSSYRHPQYSTRLPWDILSGIIDGSSTSSLDRAVGAVLNTPDQRMRTPQVSLFEPTESEGD